MGKGEHGVERHGEREQQKMGEGMRKGEEEEEGGERLYQSIK